jgi:hypothetical protein
VGDLARLERKLSALADGVESPRVVRAAGFAAKRGVLDVAQQVAGPDRRVSGWGKRGVQLGAGFDQTGRREITINLRPSGVWKVMEEGRKGGAVVRPRKRGGKRAVVTPFGPKASVRLGAMRGKSAVSRAESRAGTDAVRAANRETAEMVRGVWR